MHAKSWKKRTHLIACLIVGHHDGRYMAEYWMMNDAGKRPEHSDNNAPDLTPSQVCPHFAWGKVADK